MLLLDVNLLAEGSFGRYEQRVLYSRYMLAPAPLSGGVIHTLACGTLARKRYTIPYAFCALGGYIPSVPAQVLYVIPLLVDVEPPSCYRLL